MGIDCLVDRLLVSIGLRWPLIASFEVWLEHLVEQILAMAQKPRSLHQRRYPVLYESSSDCKSSAVRSKPPGFSVNGIVANLFVKWGRTGVGEDRIQGHGPSPIVLPRLTVHLVPAPLPSAGSDRPFSRWSVYVVVSLSCWRGSPAGKAKAGVSCAHRVAPEAANCIKNSSPCDRLNE